MSDHVTFFTILSLLKIVLGLSIVAPAPIFFFKLLTGRYSFVKSKAGGLSVAGALMPDAEFVQKAFEEVRQSKRSELGRAGEKPRASQPHAPIVVTVAANGSFKVEIPDDAFERDDAGR